MRFDLNLLHALDALLSECNVTRAAERLNVTQPTMSGMLQRLRFQFDDPLLAKNGRNMELTPFAKSLIEPLDKALKEVESLVNAGANFNPLTSTQSFSIMASNYCTSIFLPQIVARLASIAPGIKLVIHSMDAPIEHLISDNVDLCIGPTELSLICSRDRVEQIFCKYIFSERYVCVVAKDHPLSEDCSLEEYLAFPHIGVHMAGIANTLEVAALRQIAPDYKPTCQVADFSMVSSMAARTNLVGLVQERLARRDAQTFPIRYFTPPFDFPEINETMLWHSRYSKDPSHIWLRKLIASEAKEWIDTSSAENRLDVSSTFGGDTCERQAHPSREVIEPASRRSFQNL